MNIFRFSILSLFVCFFLIVGCKPEAPNKDAKTNKTIVKPTVKKVPNKKNSSSKKTAIKPIDKAFWLAAKKEAGVGPTQASAIRKITAKYDKQIASLKKAKKWDGKPNVKTRAQVNKSKEDELKKLLAKKYLKYSVFKKKWASKQAAKKKKK